MRTNNFFALFMEQGTGKTIPTLLRIVELLKSQKIENALVVAPKSTLGAWERDSDLFEDDEKKLIKNKVTFVNYDKVWRGDKKSHYYKSYGCIVLDEAHCIKNRTSKRAKFLLKIATMSTYRYILTGTPISNGQLENIWSLYCFLDPILVKGRVQSKIFNGPYKTFENRYCLLNIYHKPSGYIHITELQKIINNYSYTVKKSQCLDLPDKLPDEIIKIKNAEKKLYHKLSVESALLEYEILAENPLSRLVKLRQLCSGHIKKEEEIIEIKNNKITILEELIEGYADNKKLVIFAEFKYSITKIAELLQKMKIKHVILDGNQKDKTIWRKFQSDKNIRIIICQYKTASAGIDLFSSDTIIYYEPTLSSNLLEQSRDRIHRTGQSNKCSYIHLLTQGTVEVSIYSALARYSDFNEKLFSEYIESYRKNFAV